MRLVRCAGTLAGERVRFALVLFQDGRDAGAVASDIAHGIASVVLPSEEELREADLLLWGVAGALQVENNSGVAGTFKPHAVLAINAPARPGAPGIAGSFRNSNTCTGYTSSTQSVTLI